MQWRERSVVIGLALILLSPGYVARAAPTKPSTGADNPAAREAVDRVAHLFSSKSSVASVRMQISNEDGQRDLTMKIWSLGDKVLIIITSPPDAAGITILKEGNNIRYYLPKSKRTVKLPPSMAMTSWMGSDFTIDDLVKESFLTRDYSISTSYNGSRGGVAVYEYTMEPHPDAAVVWGKIVLQIRQADAAPTWQGFYDEDGKLARELTFSEYKKVDGRLIPTRLVMKPADKAGAHTTIDYQDIAFDVPVSEGTFVLPSLK
jgi:outer membrane lipoprotein-sorting protein